MTCDRASFMLERRWDKTLNGEEERALDEHIRGCATCAAEAQAITLADAAFLKLPDREPPMDIAAAVARQIAEEAPAEPHRAWFWTAVAAMATLVVIVLRFGMPVPSGLLAGPYYTAARDVLHAVGASVAAWLWPVAALLKCAAPAAPVLVPVLAVVGVIETSLLGRWFIRRGGQRRIAGQV